MADLAEVEGKDLIDRHGRHSVFALVEKVPVPVAPSAAIPTDWTAAP